MKVINNSIANSALGLLPKGSPKKLLLLLIFQICTSILDIVAIVLLGIVSKLGLDFSQGKSVSFPETIIKILHLEGFEFVAQIGIVSLLVIILFTLRTVVSVYGNRRVFLYLANQASFASREIVNRMFRSKPQFVIQRKSQEFLYSITQGVDSLTLGYLGSLMIFVAELVFLTLMVIVVIAMEPVTGLIAFFIFSVASIGIHNVTSGKSKKIASEYTDLYVLYNKLLLETLHVYRELVLRQKEVSVTGEIHAARSKSLNLRARLIFFPALSKYLFELVLVLGSALISLIQLVLSDTLTAISSVTVFLAVASRVLPSLIRAQGALLSIRQSEGSAEITLRQLSELEIETSSELPGPQRMREKMKFDPRLRIRNLNFAYDINSNFSLKDVNLDVKPGQFVAIVGESGSGKTTLIDLMLGMLTPTHGEVEISNLSPFEAVRHWPGKIAYVPQDVMIIDGDIKKNIALEENDEISETDIRVALEKAHLIDDVKGLPLGLSEVVGERGIRLSGGQRQRLGIARALYTKPEIIFFDEATSALDPITEKTITESIYGRKGQVTVIVVAHRLSTVKNADLVVLMERGEIIAQGTFDEVRNFSPKFDQQAKLVSL
jgi:ABC-type multidrug transport system fused ATPase/permease subunit